jgi:hypothetical protein
MPKSMMSTMNLSCPVAAAVGKAADLVERLAAQLSGAPAPPARANETLLWMAVGASAAAVMFVIELPEMIRYYRMTKL